jgi:hypothetical protein
MPTARPGRHRPSLRRFGVVGVSAAAALALPAVASGATYCVGPGAACPPDGLARPTFGQALTDASAAGDRVVLGPGTYSSPTGFVVAGGAGALTIVGAGSAAGGTTITRTAVVKSSGYEAGTVLNLQNRPVDLSGVAVEMLRPTGNGAGFAETFGVSAGATSRLHDLVVRTIPGYEDAAVSGATGFDLRGSVRVERATVDVRGSASTKGAVVDEATDLAAPVTLEDSDVRADGGVGSGVQADDAAVAIRRSTITSAGGPVDASNGSLRVESSLLIGRNSRVIADGPAGAAATFDNVTIVPRPVPGGAQGRGLEVWGDGGTASATVRDSIVSGLNTPVARRGTAPHAGNVTIERSDLHAEGAPVSEAGPGTSTQSGVVSVDPVFADPAAGDHRLAPASPLIDAGLTLPPAGLGPDRDGAARVADGDGDGTATLDLGAYEHAAPVVPETPATPPTTTTPGGTPPTTTVPGSTRPVVPPRKAAFGSATKVTLRLRSGRVGVAGPVRVVVRNANGFGVPARLSGTTPRAGRRRAIAYAAGRRTLAAGSSTTIAVRLPAAARRVLRSKGRLTLRLAVRVSAPDGGVRTVRRTVTVRRRS